MTDQQEFIKNYCHDSGITTELFKKHFVALPCNCDWDQCPGWMAVSNDAKSIETYKKLHGII